MTQDAWRAAKESLHERVRNNSDFTGIGLTRVDGADAIVVLLVTGSEAESIPTEWQGYPVKVEVVGVISPEGNNDG